MLTLVNRECVELKHRVVDDLRTKKSRYMRSLIMFRPILSEKLEISVTKKICKEKMSVNSFSKIN